MKASEQKRHAIARALRETRERRKGQRCRAFEVKVDRSHLGRRTSEHLSRLFLEAKWFYNHVIAQPDVLDVDTKVGEVPVKVGDHLEIRELRCLSSQMKQGLATRVRDAVRALSQLKKTGRKVGRLKFRNKVSSIPLKQFGKTYRIISGNRIGIQGMKRSVRVRGLKQIPPGADVANAFLIRRGEDHFVKIVTFLPTEDVPSVIGTGIGIDFGLASQLTFSNGIAVRYRITIPRRLRKLYRRWSKKKWRSGNWWKVLAEIERAFARLTNIKRDICNRVVSHLKRHHGRACFQTENLRAWQRLWGRKMLDTSLGRLIGILRERMPIPVEVSRFFPSTQVCSRCGHRQKLPLDERIYRCPECGLEMDRDVNAALNILHKGLESLGAERAEVTPAEIAASADAMVDCLSCIPRVSVSRVREAGSLTALA